MLVYERRGYEKAGVHLLAHAEGAEEATAGTAGGKGADSGRRDQVAGAAAAPLPQPHC